MRKKKQIKKKDWKFGEGGRGKNKQINACRFCFCAQTCYVCSNAAKKEWAVLLSHTTHTTHNNKGLLNSLLSQRLGWYCAYTNSQTMHDNAHTPFCLGACVGQIAATFFVWGTKTWNTHTHTLSISRGKTEHNFSMVQFVRIKTLKKKNCAGLSFGNSKKKRTKRKFLIFFWKYFFLLLFVSLICSLWSWFCKKGFFFFCGKN